MQTISTTLTSNKSSPAVCERGPLYVDMDGTLLATDVLWELLILLIKRRPLLLLRLPAWLLKGRAFLKHQLASQLTLDPTLLPYHKPVIAYLTTERERGRDIVLATASDQRVAESVARHVGLFSSVLASNGTVTLGGRAKLSAILQHAQGVPFEYIGNSQTDLHIWKRASAATLVRPSRRLATRVKASSNVKAVLVARKSILGSVSRMLRVHQWPKNALLLVPLVLAHRITDFGRSVNGFLALIAFCLAASAVYIVNDLLDLESDRQHPLKRSRPLAAGLVPIHVAAGIAIIAFVSSVTIAFGFLSGPFVGILLIYLITTTAYSLILKRSAIVDVLVLASLYTLRVVAGAVATQVSPSQWFLAFSMFFFLSLAFLKRYTELHSAAQKGEDQNYLRARGYVVGDKDLLGNVGSTTGYLAVVVFALYINSPEVGMVYSRPVALWLIGPLLLYWLTRVWLLASRGQMHGDPVVFAFKDKSSYVLAALVAMILVVARPK